MPTAAAVAVRCLGCGAWSERPVCRRCRRPDPEPPPPPWATIHLPGSLGKLIVLEWRRANGFQLWHPDDAAEDPQPHGPAAVRVQPRGCRLPRLVHVSQDLLVCLE
jgi:hypothetical protein